MARNPGIYIPGLTASATVDCSWPISAANKDFETGLLAFPLGRTFLGESAWAFHEILGHQHFLVDRKIVVPGFGRGKGLR